ncbi:MAG TPA: pyridoxal-phosphate dependent enzyme [Acetobacteraceae bacterium]
MELELEALVGNNNFIRVQGLLRANFYLKLECLNPAGSIEFKTALGLIKGCEAAGVIRKNTVVVESSSGRLGIALAMICAERGYRFKCIVDPSISACHSSAMRALGADITYVSEQDTIDGRRGSRLEHIRELTSRDPRYVWASQYGSQASLGIHAELTATAIADRFPHLDYLFLDAGGMGALMGCARHFSRWRPKTKIVAVNGVGSIALGGSATPRYVPGTEASQAPMSGELGSSYATVSVPEVAAVSSCRYLARSYGVLAGGSTGNVMTAVLSWRARFRQGEVVVAVAPDTGEQCLETIYDDEWVISKFGGDALLPERYADFIDECVTSYATESVSVREGVAYA